jgi:hypothetical protein
MAATGGSMKPKARPAVQQIDLNLVGTEDHPLLYASQLLVNFVGTEFLVTVVDATPEPYTGPPKPVTGKTKARVLGRYAFNINQWALIVHSLGKQVEEVRAMGVLYEVEMPEGPNAS